MTANDKAQVPGRLLTAAAICVVTVGAYLSFLGWDQAKDVQRDGSRTGPYQAWQVIGLAVLIGVSAFVAGLNGRPWVATAVITVTLTVCWTVDAATDADGQGLWPIGSVMVAGGTFACVTFVTALGADVAEPADYSMTAL